MEKGARKDLEIYIGPLAWVLPSHQNIASREELGLV